MAKTTIRDNVRRWRLTDAKARFSEVVRLARSHPQRVTVDGEDAVVIMSAEAYDRERRRQTGADLVKVFANPILADLDFERNPVIGSIRDVDL